MRNIKSVPTTEQWSAYQATYDHFNIFLFNGELSNVILNFSRHANAYGFFAAHRWHHGEHYTHEISLNPDLLDRLEADSQEEAIRGVMATLVHEMVHLWQLEFGKHKSKRGYHNREWVSAMLTLGLQPISDNPNGTGFKVHHEIIEGGLFAQACDAIHPELLLPWTSYHTSSTIQSGGDLCRNKLKYSCHSCKANVWGKDGLLIWCVSCNAPYFTSTT